MSWIEKLLPPRVKPATTPRRSMPEGIWQKCPSCSAVLYRDELEANQNVCLKCSFHNRISARRRLLQLLDSEGCFEIAGEIISDDPLNFFEYRKRLTTAKESSSENDALLVMQGAIKTIPLVACAFEFGFMGGSMGSVVGERFVSGVRLAIDKRIPFVCITSTGGARMQEGLFSLLQMAKTNAALTLLAKNRLPFITILADPTTGGVSASFAMISDVVIAEPGALIGFAGARVIEGTVKEKLPEGFQRSEFLLKKGAIDMIVDRRNLRQTLANLLSQMLRQHATPT